MLAEDKKPVVEEQDAQAMQEQSVHEEQDVEVKTPPKKSKKTFSLSKDKKLKKQLEELKLEISELKDKHLRLFAEFDNYKKRSNKERLDLVTTAAQSTIFSLLPVLDDFDRAKKSADDENTDEAFSDGVSMVYNKLYAVLDQKGLVPMETNGEIFDPELHEAISEIPAGEDMKGKIIDTVEKGYQLGDKIIRHAKVVVGN